MNRCALAGVLVLLAAVFCSCGNPQITVPAALEVSYMPLDGAVDQEWDVEVLIYFSGEVDDGSVSTDTVMFESAAFDGTDCGLEWSPTDLVPEVDSEQAMIVRIFGQQPLDADTCYRISCTTDVKGDKLGPLVDLGLEGRPGIGAEAVFRTRP